MCSDGIMSVWSGLRRRSGAAWVLGSAGRGHGCSSVVFIVCCGGSGTCDGLISGLEECYRLRACVHACVCVSVI